MGVVGAIIMGFFGAVFAALTMAFPLKWTGSSIALPFIVFALILIAAIFVLRKPGRGASFSPQARKATMWASTAEGFGIFLAANVVQNIGHPEWLLPAMALVVGLHFIPIAYAATVPFFYALAAVLLGAAAIGVVVGGTLGAAMAGFTAAIALWLAALRALIRDYQAKA